MELDEIINAFYGELKGSKKPNLEVGKIALRKPDKFDKRSIDRITNFKPSNDALDIVADSFGIDSFATFAAGKKQERTQEAC